MSIRPAASAVSLLAAGSLLLSAGLALPAQAVLVIDGKDGRRLTPPDGELTGSGWQYEGFWGKSVGTPIGPYHFVTAKHVGGAVGQAFAYRGLIYHAEECLPAPGADLAVWRVDERLPDWAPLFLDGDEVGRSVTVFGRGTARGVRVYREGQLCGWQWGPPDHALSWGKDTVVNVDGQGLLDFTFDARDGAENTCQVSTGDSGGGVFTRAADGRWKLVGVIYGLDNGFSRSPTGPSFPAALFDERGFFVGPRRQYIPPVERAPVPGIWYASRISSSRDFLQSALARPRSGIRLIWRLLGRFVLFSLVALSTAALVKGPAERLLGRVLPRLARLGRRRTAAATTA